jgi:hypothetical protein
VTLQDLQQRLAEHGITGPDLRQNIITFLTSGPDFLLEDVDFANAASMLGVPVAYVRALYQVESSGSPFIGGRPTILFEPHRFSRATGHLFDATHPNVSYPNWNPALYPRTQAARYEQLTEAVCLDPDAGFGSASYGGFQILGENYARCQARDAMAFAWQESQTAADQLNHFCFFVESDQVLHDGLRSADWVTVAKRYNGTAYARNRYDVRLARAARMAAAA